MQGIAKAVTNSLNVKLGVASTTYVSQVSCPSDCVFRNAGCYAERGTVGMVATRHLNKTAEEENADAIDVARAEAEAIDTMATVVGRPLRLHTVGDCASDEAARIVSEAAERYMERGGGQAWTYTHGWRDVERSSWGAVSVLASCETQEQVMEAAERGYAAAIVVDEFADRRRHNIGLIDILPCPAQTTESVHCSSCRLCFDDEAILERGYAIGFEVHGTHDTKRKALATLREENQ